MNAAWIGSVDNAHAQPPTTTAPTPIADSFSGFCLEGPDTESARCSLVVMALLRKLLPTLVDFTR